MNNHSKKNVKRELFVGAIIVLITANLLIGSLTIASFEKLFVKSLILSYQAVSKDLQRNIERSVQFGKPLDKFIGIEKMFEDLKEDNPDLHHIAVATPNGKILYHLNYSAEYLPPGLKLDFLDQKGKKKVRYAKENVPVEKNYHVLLPIRGRNQEWIGTIDIGFQEELIQNKIYSMIWWNLQILGAITLIVSAILAIALKKNWIDLNMVGGHKKRLYLILFVIVGGGQIIYSYFNIQFFKSKYIEIIRNQTEDVSRQFKNNIEYLINKGIQIDRLIKIDVLMNDILAATPEIETIQILDKANKPLYSSNSQSASASHSDFPEDSLYHLRFPLKKGDELMGILKVQISQKMVWGKIKEIILDCVTVVVISLIFITELMLLLFMFLNKLDYPSERTDKPKKTRKFSIIRPAAFLYQTALALPVSFVPLFAEELYEPLWGLSKEFVMGLPLSANMFCVMIAFLIGGKWMDRRGWQSLHFWGVLLSILGLFLCGTARNNIEFISYRGLLGLGYGFTNLSYMGFVYTHTDDKNRTLGFAVMTAGLFSGSICGGVIGGMLAERLGFRPVFIVGSILMWIVIVFQFVFMKPLYQKQESLQTHKTINFRLLFQFLTHRNIFSLIFLLGIPSSIVFTGLLYYASPIFLDRLGTSQANIARILMINGIFMIYVPPMIGPLIDRSTSKKIYLAVSGLLGASCLLVFNYVDGILAMILAIVMMSLSNCIGTSSRTVYVLQQNISLKLGGGPSMSIYRTIDRIGWVLGPLVLGMIMTSGGFATGLLMAGGIYLILTLLFILINRDEKPA